MCEGLPGQLTPSFFFINSGRDKTYCSDPGTGGREDLTPAGTLLGRNQVLTDSIIKGLQPLRQQLAWGTMT